MPEADFQRLVDLLAREGYDTSKIRKVPQRWESTASLGVVHP